MVTKVYTPNVVYTTNSKEEEFKPAERIVIGDCKLTRTQYGSVLVRRPNVSHVLELYPSNITHVIHEE